MTNTNIMDKKQVLMAVRLFLIALGVLMIYLGGFANTMVILPPIITGIGFFAIAWALGVLMRD